MCELQLAHSFLQGSHLRCPLLCSQAWALFKGKFREGIDKPDPPTWKTRLRCALNKSNDFEELVERSQLDISDPYKVYRIVPEGAKKGRAEGSWKFDLAKHHWRGAWLTHCSQQQGHNVTFVSARQLVGVVVAMWVPGVLLPSFVGPGLEPRNLCCQQSTQPGRRLS